MMRGRGEVAQVEIRREMAVNGVRWHCGALIGTSAKLDDVGTSGREKYESDLRRFGVLFFCQMAQPIPAGLRSYRTFPNGSS